MLEADSIRKRVSRRKPASPLTARGQVVSKVLPNGVAAEYPTTKTRLLRGAFMRQLNQAIRCRIMQALQPPKPNEFFNTNSWTNGRAPSATQSSGSSGSGA